MKSRKADARTHPGAIRPGMRALLQLLPHRDERAYVHEVAGAGPDVTIIGEDVSVRVA